MAFTRRPMQTGDREACFAMLPERFIYDTTRRKILLSLWKELLEGECCVADVVEDRRKARGYRISGFGFSIFLTDNFARLAKQNLPPFLPLSLIRHWEEGKKPFLTGEEIKKADADKGLTLLDIHYGWDLTLGPEELFKVQHLLQENFISSHAGYRFKEFLHEVYGSESRDYLLGGGNFLRRDYRECLGASLKGVPEKVRPYLVGCTREEAFGHPGSYMAVFFSKMTRARFPFNPGEKKILERALAGDTDEDIAESLHFSPWTIKKRWQTLYDKVMKVDPELLTDSSQPRTHDAPARQRRRFLLDYLRSHPEEIRMGQVAGKKV